MDRREFLTAGATLAIAVAGGCTGCARAPAAALRMRPTTDREIAERVTYRLHEGSSPGYRLVAGAVENGSATAEGTDPPLPANRSVVYDGAVYRLGREVVDSVPATAFSFTLDPVDGSVSESETVGFEDLPAVDREKLAARGWADGDPLGVGSSLRYREREVPESALVPEPDRPVIVWDDETSGRFEVDGSRETSLKTYRYRAEQVDPSAEAYGAEVRERYAFALSGLSSAERDIVSQAIEDEGGYYVPGGEKPPDAVWNLARRFRPREEVRSAWEDDEDGRTVPGVDGTYLVRYDGEVYWTEIRVSREAFTTTASDEWL
ncbi:twin-arginine translocation signal domain-containing protein [Halorussus sp. AFM4]|uniref:twin-arginine translocation signal domain-containing protein n=1 Tax=Halorussus sp. AFM4 TaxID=3421651 RepID=UPI003EBA35C9